MSERYALYFAPAADSTLNQTAVKWLQYDAYTGDFIIDENSINRLPIDRSSYESYIKNPSQYGFHATLKAPFRLKKNRSVEELIEALYEFCSNKAPIVCSKLEVIPLGNFIALGLEKPSIKLNNFAQQCVAHFDYFRAELNPQEIKKRNPINLTKRQQVLLDQWGYPYVDDEYRFHLTLTSSLPDDQRDIVKKYLQSLFSGVLDNNIKVDAIHLFHQENAHSHFKVIQSFYLKNQLHQNRTFKR